MTSVSNGINSTYSILNSNLASNSISNCGSVKFDLIDFCDFIGDTTEYDARIVVIFSAFVGVFGYVMLYSFLVVFNSLTGLDNDNDYEDYGYNYGKKKNKIRNINIKVNSAKPIQRESSEYDKDEEEEDDDEYKKKLNNKKKIVPKTAQKVEMSYLSNNNNQDSDSS